MDLAFYKQLSQTNDWLALWPELGLAVLALLLLVAELMLPARWRKEIGGLALLGQLALLIGLVVTLFMGGGIAEPRMLFADLIRQTPLTDIYRVFFLSIGIAVSHLGVIYLSRRALAKVEFFVIVQVITASLMILVQAADFALLFVALETVTVGFYILVSYCRTSPLSLEAGLKYLITGALSSAILLFGIMLLYGVAGNPLLSATSGTPFQFTAVANFLEANPHNLIAITGVLFVLCGVAFKIGVVPFQIWIPDVYQGAPTPTTAFLSVGSKAGGFILLVHLLQGPFASLQSFLQPVLMATAAITILFGNLAALGQRNVKRVMGLSGVSHAGYLLMGVIAMPYVDWAVYAVLFYLFVYALGSFAVFEVMALMSGDEDAEQEMEDYEDLMNQNTFLGSVLVIGLGSLAGIPPLGGFIAKFLIFFAAFQANMLTLLLIGAFGVVLSIYYYFGWIRATVLRATLTEDEKSPHPTWMAVPLSARLLMILFAGFSVGLGLYQGLITQLMP